MTANRDTEDSIDPSLLGNTELPEVLSALAKTVHENHGECYIVGGWVRDLLIGQHSKDFDIEIHGIKAEQLEKILRRFGVTHYVGKSFGVYHLEVQGKLYDVALPRRERKTGQGHKGFEVEADPDLNFEEASARRDFTVNAMGYLIIEKKLVDPHGGLRDLKRGVLRHVSNAFSEDPLRALRAVQMAARFEFDIDGNTQKLCSIQPIGELPAERIYEEWKKLLLKAKKPSLGLMWLDKLDLLRFFPELAALKGVEQEPEWHPEGDVWTHTLMVIDEAAIIRDNEICEDHPDAEFERMVLMLGALCHDFGKPHATRFEDGRWRSPGHEPLGEKPTRKFLAGLTREAKLIEEVVALVREHLKPALLYREKDRLNQSSIRRLALRVDIPRLVRTAKADHFGRTTPDAIAREFPPGQWLLEEAAKLGVRDEKPTPYLQGRHLLQLGLKPGPHLGKLIQKSFELQLEGKITDVEAAIEWARKEI